MDHTILRRDERQFYDSGLEWTRIYMVTTGVEHKRKMEYMRLII